LKAADVAALAAQDGLSLEEAGRRVRYAFFALTSAEFADRPADFPPVAVAHHADDQVETVVMNVLKGTGLAGLAGMRARARVPLSSSEIAALWDRLGWSPSTPWLSRAGSVPALSRADPQPHPAWPPALHRPLLDVRRAEVDAYLAERGIPYRDDPSNADLGFLRNRVRHEVLPSLERLNPRVREALLRTAAIVSEEADFLELAARDAYAACRREAPLVGDGGTTPHPESQPERAILAVEAFSALHPAMQRRVVRLAANQLGSDARELGFDHVEAIRALAGAPPGTSQPLPGLLQASRTPGAIELTGWAAALPPVVVPDAVRLPVPGNLTLAGGWSLTSMERPRTAHDPIRHDDRWQVAIDAGALHAPLEVRPRRPGDVMQPLGLGGRSKTLQDVFVDARVPRAERALWPVVVAGGAVVWVPGLRLDERVKVRPSTERIVELRAVPPGR
jgi:tRNA(Ile)-lysidine synthetase-like protein